MFDFSPEHVNLLKRYISEARLDEQSELEVRFSTFIRPDLFENGKTTNVKSKDAPERYRFWPIVDIETFYRVMNEYESYGLACDKTSAVDTFYETVDSQGKRHSLRHCLIQNSDGTISSQWMTKKKSKITDIWQINTRICLSSEILLTKASAPHGSSSMVRRKERTSFLDQNVRYDFTVVTTETTDKTKQKGITTARTSYEIELEILTGTADSTQDVILNEEEMLQHVMFCFKHLLQVIQESPAIMTIVEKHNALVEYSVLTDWGVSNGKPRFIGAQPETLHKRHLPLIKKKNTYSVTEKYDGERNHLFINYNGEAYLINRKCRIRTTGLTNSQNGKTLLDVELLKGRLYAFDILFYQGEDLRNNPSYMLRPRLDMTRHVVQEIFAKNQTHTMCIPIDMKPFYFSNFEQVMKEANEGLVHGEIDGFIYTPLFEPYPKKAKWPGLLKWKPPELNSIDFLVKRIENHQGNSDKQVWSLYVGKEEGVAVSFEPYPQITVDFGVCKEICGDDLHGDSLGIIECVWDFENETFKPLRKRSDKNTPNFISVAMDVWESIQNPVRLCDLQRSPLETMRQHHNLIKSMLISQTIRFVSENAHFPHSSTLFSWADSVDEFDNDVTEKRLVSVLDLACGRGGDLWKWSSSANENNLHLEYFGLDVNETLLEEAKSRAVQVARKYPESFQFARCDLTFEYPPNSFVENRQFDVISCQFALHYFFQSEETFNHFFNIITSCLKKNGIFICSLFDGDQVLHYLRNNKVCKNQEDELFDMEPLFDYNSSDVSEFNTGIKVSLLGDADVILKEMTTEYLVFPEKFVTRMKTLGFRLEQSELFLNVQTELQDKLTPSEKIYSNLHRYYQFIFESPPCRRTNSAEEDEEKNDKKNVENDIESIELKVKQLTIAQEQEEKPDDSWSIKAIKEYAKAKGIKISSAIRKKADILDLVCRNN